MPHRTAPVGLLFASPADISWGRDDVLVQPDLFVLPSVRADRFTKRTLYQKMGVPLYGIVDADAHAVEIWTPDAHFPTVERETLAWQPAPDAARFACALADLFQPL